MWNLTHLLLLLTFIVITLTLVFTIILLTLTSSSSILTTLFIKYYPDYPLLLTNSYIHLLLHLQFSQCLILVDIQ